MTKITEYKTRIHITLDHNTIMNRIGNRCTVTIEYDLDNVTYHAKYGYTYNLTTDEPYVFIVDKDILTIRAYNDYSVSEVIYKYKQCNYHDVLKYPLRMFYTWDNHTIIYNYMTNTYDYMLSLMPDNDVNDPLVLMNDIITRLDG